MGLSFTFMSINPPLPAQRTAPEHERRSSNSNRRADHATSVLHQYPTAHQADDDAVSVLGGAGWRAGLLPGTCMCVRVLCVVVLTVDPKETGSTYAIYAFSTNPCTSPINCRRTRPSASRNLETRAMSTETPGPKSLARRSRKMLECWIGEMVGLVHV